MLSAPFRAVPKSSSWPIQVPPSCSHAAPLAMTAPSFLRCRFSAVAILGTSLFSDTADDDFGRFNRSFITVSVAFTDYYCCCCCCYYYYYYWRCRLWSLQPLVHHGIGGYVYHFFTTTTTITTATAITSTSTAAAALLLLLLPPLPPPPPPLLLLLMLLLLHWTLIAPTVPLYAVCDYSLRSDICSLRIWICMCLYS